ncbi:Smr/MutS family protein [Tabrizicola sp. J26]|uniref:Smr/MutS family protein n=1 Tax=Alitabrizicola rongguiensis TaxID=2909234 RepID=UPI001F20A19E|nr:Smr/MutS family protein [Tabrizicola rongguiensis]MCF1708221.1 Smr/MutS family protein [Tabrizicola rongguiensis]
MARRRTLRPEEEDLWQSVARTAQPLHPQKSPSLDQLRSPLPTESSQKAEQPEPIRTFRVGERAQTVLGHDLSPSISDSMTRAPLRMDAKAFAQMSRGKLSPEARIDLHGMTLAEAHPELIRFVLNAQSQGLRLVLVITGKGKRMEDSGPIPQRVGVLKHSVPQWLRLPPLAPAILQVAEAHLKHGGSGAYYVYLRRSR